MGLSVLTGQRRRTINSFRFDLGDQRADRQLAVTRRPLAIPAPARRPTVTPSFRARSGSVTSRRVRARRTQRWGVARIARGTLDRRPSVDRVQAAIWRFVVGLAALNNGAA